MKTATFLLSLSSGPEVPQQVVRRRERRLGHQLGHERRVRHLVEGEVFGRQSPVVDPERIVVLTSGLIALRPLLRDPVGLAVSADVALLVGQPHGWRVYQLADVEGSRVGKGL